MPRPTIDEYKAKWADAFIAAGHTFTLNEEGDPDHFAVSSEGHNGPECEACGWSCCEHCTNAESIPVCEGAAKKKADLLSTAEWYEKMAAERRAEAAQIET